MTIETGQTTNGILDLFMQYTDGLPSPPIFRKWAGLSMIAGCLERRVWTKALRVKICPNLWVLIVGPPGGGKSTSINVVSDIWTSTGDLNVAPTSLTKAAFEEQLLEKQRMMPNGERHHALNIASSEFGVLVPKHDLEFLNTLNDIYDCRNIYERKTKSGGLTKIEYPHLNMIAGSTPKYLGAILPEAAYGMGFTSRMIMVYSDENVYVDLFSDFDTASGFRKKLLTEAKRITKIEGEYIWEPDAANVISSWHKAGMQPLPTHSKLQSYLPRRIAHIIKLCMIFSANRNNLRLITEEDAQNALDALLEVEIKMPEVFKEMTHESDTELMQEVYNFTIAQYNRDNKGVREYLIMRFITKYAPAHRANFILSALINSKLLEEIHPGIPEGHRKFKPGTKGEFE